MTSAGPRIVVGDSLPTQRYSLSRSDLVRYAGASGDFNPIHWSRETAQAVGLPDVIAHGMLTMAVAGRLVTDWLGDPGAIESYGVRFTRPVPVDADEPTAIEVAGVIADITPEGRAVIELKVTLAGKTVLSKARISVRVTDRDV